MDVGRPHLVANGLIAFMRPGKVGEYDLWVVRPDGTGRHRLTKGFSAAWNPAG